MHSIKRHTTTLIIVAIIAIILGAMAYLLLQPQPASSPGANGAVSQDTDKVDSSPKPAPPAPVAGTFVTYSADAVAAAKGTKLLFFHAPWCPQCRELEASINASEIPADITIFKVDYDSNQALRQKYGVTLQTTFVSVDESGNKIKSFVAYDEPTFDAVKKAFGL